MCAKHLNIVKKSQNIDGDERSRTSVTLCINEPFLQPKSTLHTNTTNMTQDHTHRLSNSALKQHKSRPDMLTVVAARREDLHGQIVMSCYLKHTSHHLNEVKNVQLLARKCSVLLNKSSCDANTKYGLPPRFCIILETLLSSKLQSRN